MGGQQIMTFFADVTFDVQLETAVQFSEWISNIETTLQQDMGIWSYYKDQLNTFDPYTMLTATGKYETLQQYDLTIHYLLTKSTSPSIRAQASRHAPVAGKPQLKYLREYFSNLPETSLVDAMKDFLDYMDPNSDYTPMQRYNKLRTFQYLKLSEREKARFLLLATNNPITLQTELHIRSQTDYQFTDLECVVNELNAAYVPPVKTIKSDDNAFDVPPSPRNNRASDEPQRTISLNDNNFTDVQSEESSVSKNNHFSDVPPERPSYSKNGSSSNVPKRKSSLQDNNSPNAPPERTNIKKRKVIPRCDYCAKYGHSTQQCYSKPKSWPGKASQEENDHNLAEEGHSSEETKVSFKKSKKCTRCNRFGHLAETCWCKTAIPNSSKSPEEIQKGTFPVKMSSSKEFTYSSKTQKDFKCTNCNKRGHVADFCWSKRPKKVPTGSRPRGLTQDTFQVKSPTSREVSFSDRADQTQDDDTLSNLMGNCSFDAMGTVNELFVRDEGSNNNVKFRITAGRERKGDLCTRLG